MNSSNVLEKWSPCARAVLRIIVGFLFLEHGTQKLFGWPMPPPIPNLPPLMITGAWMEFLGGILIVLGLLTRPVALILCGEMAFAFWHFHFKSTAQLPLVNKGELAVVYCFVFFYFIFAGPGSVSLDNLIWKKGTERGREGK